MVGGRQFRLRNPAVDYFIEISPEVKLTKKCLGNGDVQESFVVKLFREPGSQSTAARVTGRVPGNAWGKRF